MPRFAYRARDSSLKVVEGTVEADSEAAAIGRLGREGVFPFTISESSRGGGPSRVRLVRRVSVRALAHLTRQLADLLGGGLPLLSALTLLSKQTEQHQLQRVIEAMATAVRDGRAFSDALSDHPKVFPPLYVSMVRAGETGGALEQALGRLADLGEHDAEMRSRLVSASAYPLFVLFISFAMTIFLMTYVIPTLSQVFIESGQLLPLPTRVLLSISELVRQYWWAMIIGVVIAGWLLRGWAASPSGKTVLDRAMIVIPGVGALARKLETGRFAKTLGVMIGQGVPVLQALNVVSRNVSNVVIQRAVTQVHDAVREGSSLAAAMEASGQFPVLVSNMVAVGEESGTVDASLAKIAVTYEREVDRAIQALTTVLEPVLLVLVGGIVMFIVLAMLLPVFQIGMVVQ